MGPDFVLELMRRAMLVAMTIGAPVLLVTLVVGVGVSVFQAATQINEMTLTFIPKLAACLLVFWIGGEWMVRHGLSFVTELWSGVLVAAG